MNTYLLIGNILGYIGIIFLYIQVVFGTRHIFAYFTKDTVLINKVHKYLGMYGILFVFLHPVFVMFARFENPFWIINISFDNIFDAAISFGRIALILTLIVWITSAIIREKIKWRPWKKIHLLSYLIVFLAFAHVPLIGTFFEEYLLVKVLWGFLFITFLISVLIRIFAWAGIFKQKFILLEKVYIGEDILIITLSSKENKKVNSKIGQHFYLQTKSFKSEHPFSIIKNDSGKLKFGIRKFGGFWQELENKKIGETILLDGPYGVFTKEAQNTSPKVIISAGIGVTPFIDLVDNFGENTIYINCNRSENEAIEKDLIQKKVSVYSEVIGEPLNQNHIKNVLGDKLLELPYFVCGSPAFVKFAKKTLLSMGISKDKVFYEELGF